MGLTCNPPKPGDESYENISKKVSINLIVPLSTKPLKLKQKYKKNKPLMPTFQFKLQLLAVHKLPFLI